MSTGWTTWASPAAWIDERGSLCPAPVIALGRAAAAHPGGTLLAVLATDPAADSDVPAWCRLRGAAYLGAVAAPDGGGGSAHLVRTAAPARTLGINHVGVSVRDLDAARAFWCGQLGFVDIGGWTWPVGTAPSDAALDLVGTSASVALLRAGSMHLELFEFHAPAPAARPAAALTGTGITHVAVAVTDVGAVVARLGAAGVSITATPDGGTAWVADPDGNDVELLEASGGDGYGVDGLVVEPHPARSDDDPAATSPTRPDVLGVHHVGIGVRALTVDSSRWATTTDCRAAVPVVWQPRPVPGASSADGLLLDAGNVRLELVDLGPELDAAAFAGRRTCDLGYNHVCLEVEGIDRWPDRLSPGDVRWHHDTVESSGGVAAVRYGRERGGVVVELLENRSSKALLWCGHLPGLLPR